jgi:hypothetical protein
LSRGRAVRYTADRDSAATETAVFSTRLLLRFRVPDTARAARPAFAFLSIPESSPFVCDPSRSLSCFRPGCFVGYRRFDVHFIPGRRGFTAIMTLVVPRGVQQIISVADECDGRAPLLWAGQSHLIMHTIKCLTAETRTKGLRFPADLFLVLNRSSFAIFPLNRAIFGLWTRCANSRRGCCLILVEPISIIDA